MWNSAKHFFPERVLHTVTFKRATGSPGAAETLGKLPQPSSFAQDLDRIFAEPGPPPLLLPNHVASAEVAPQKASLGALCGLTELMWLRSSRRVIKGESPPRKA